MQNWFFLVENTIIWHLAISGTLEGVFAQILGDDDNIREKAIKFLGTKIKTLPEDTIDKDCEEYLVSECKKVR